MWTSSLWNYYYCKIERPYFNESIALLWNITNAIYFWVTSSLLLCMCLQNSAFSGGVQLITLGIPVVFFVEFYSEHPAKKILAQGLEACGNGEECELYLRFLSYVINNRKEKSNSKIIC